ncbi:MAG: hypothetical protein JWN67_423 [Actinomycetia bacterium]|nr:hypothetical protein [Actinomycetes bacterium]
MIATMSTPTPKELARDLVSDLPNLDELTAVETELAGLPAAVDAALDADDEDEVVRLQGRRLVLERAVERLRPLAAREIADALEERHTAMAAEAIAAAERYADVVRAIQPQIAEAKAAMERARQDAQQVIYDIDRARAAVGLMSLGAGVQGVTDAEMVEKFLADHVLPKVMMDGRPPWEAPGAPYKEQLGDLVTMRDPREDQRIKAGGVFTMPRPNF